MLALGTVAPDFSLPAANGGPAVSLATVPEGKPFLIVFMCNHCPYVIHIRDVLIDFAQEFKMRGVTTLGINSNDAESYPADAPDKMALAIQTYGFTFPYLVDADQSVARSYRAACTPDFFLFDRNRKLVYRGQFDSSRPGNSVPVTGADLRAALEAVLAGNAPSSRQRPSMGCNIKWKPGREPDYFSSPPKPSK